MPTGVPIALKCPRCRRGQYGYPKPIEGVRQTGVFETKVQARSTRRRGRGPRVYRQRVRCLDCKHEWWSTLPGVAKEAWRDLLK